MKKAITIIFLLFIVLFTYGQDSILDNKLCIKIAPLAIFDIYGGMSPRIGVEYKLKNNFSLYNEIGTYIPNANGMSNNYGILTKFEFKAYLNKSKRTSGSYISAELFYKQQSYYTYDSIYNSVNYNLKDYFVSKKVGCITIKYGFLQVYKFNLIIDGFVGLGIRYKVAESSLTKEENNNIQPEGVYRTNILKNKSGVFTNINFDAGVKIGYRLK